MITNLVIFTSYIYLVIIYLHSMSRIFLKNILFLKIDFMVTTWNFHMVVCFKANLHYEKRNLSPKIYFQTYECFSQLYTEGKARKVIFLFENSTGHKIEFSVHVTLAKMKSAIYLSYYYDK